MKNFKKSNINFLRAFDRTRGGQKSEKIEFTVSVAVHVRLNPVAMLGEPPRSSPAPSAPTRAVRKGGEEEERAQDPPSSSSARCTSPTIVASPEPTHSTPSPRPNPTSTRARPPCPVLLVARRQGPRTSELLDALAPDSLAYKNPRRSNERSHPTPSSLPDNLSSLRSLSFDVASPAGEVLDAGSAAALGRRWTSRRRELEEEHRRSLFRPSPSSPASSTRAAVAIVVFSARR
jgi:hypothetical protein